MGVDYTANYGIGIKVLEPDYEELGIDGDMLEYMESHLPEPPEGLELEFFEVGEGSYTGENNDFYLCFKYSFTEGLDALAIKKKLFEYYLEDNDIITEGEIDLVGGLNVW